MTTLPRIKEVSRRFGASAIAIALIAAVLFAGFPGNILQKYFDDKNVIDRSFGLATAHANPGTRSRTVMFYIGTFASNGLNNFKSLNTTNTLPDANGNFQIRLMENSVTIRDAFVDWTVHFNASGTATQANSLFQAFDACSDPCTPSAWGGTGAALTNYTTDYFSNSGESNVANFKQDVTAEGQLASYVGGGAVLDAQFGYCIGTASTCTGAAAVTQQISYVTGVLYITYTYDDTSPNITNTVIYPLESAASGDSGSKRASQAAGCTLGSNCPKFNYNMELPEFSSGNQLSQWFALNGAGNSGNTTDYSMTARIGTNAQSAAQIFEEARSGNDFGMRFLMNGLVGYTENTTSTLERTGTAVAVATMGGEVFETYAASSSASIKTRTISFPLGEICTQQTTSTCSVVVDVSFPEGGVAVKKAWIRNSYSVSSSTTPTLTIAAKVGALATTSLAYTMSNMNLAVVQMDYVYYVIPSSTYATLQGATPASPITLAVADTFSSPRGATGGELMITYTYTNETGGYNAWQALFAGTSDNDNNKTAWSAGSGLVAPSIPESSGVTVLKAGLLASLLAMDSDGLVPLNHGGIANTTMSMGAALSTGACTATYTSIPNTVTEVNVVYLYKDVTPVVTSSSVQTYTPCYTDRDNTSDNTAGFQVSGMFIFLYQVAISTPGGNPTVSNILLNGGSNITLTPNATTAVAIVASATDPGGAGNISFATGTIYRTSLGQACSSNGANCYQIPSSRCVWSGSRSTVTCIADIYYFAQSTGNASASFPSDSWTGAITITNGSGGTDNGTSSVVQMNVLSAINVTTSSINYGTITASSTTGGTNQMTVVQNVGNSSTTLQISGTALVKGINLIATSSQHYATSSFSYGGLEQSLNSTPTIVPGFLLTSPTSTGAVQNAIYWGLAVGAGAPTGTYNGTTTFTAIFSQ